MGGSPADENRGLPPEIARAPVRARTRTGRRGRLLIAHGLGPATAVVVLLTLVFAWNQQYLLDWDACFRAFTGFAARDIAVGLVTGRVRNRADAVRILTKYSDYFEARPGSLVSYPPGQTAVLAVLSLVSTNAFFLALFNVALFACLSLGMWRLAGRFGFGTPGRYAAWATVCLHPTILLTVWSLRRGMFEAAAVTWFLVWGIDYLHRPEARTALRMVILIAAGFLYRETLAVLALPAVVLFVREFPEKPSWRAPGNRRLGGIAAAAILCAGVFSTAEIILAASGRLSIFSKVFVNTHRDAAPPRGILTMWGYYRGQFGPENILGRSLRELTDSGVAPVYRLARARWKLALWQKLVYLASSVFANPASAFLLLLLFFPEGRRLVRMHRRQFAWCAGVSGLYFLLLCPLGGIPDYVTPILPGLGVLAGAAVQALAAESAPWAHAAAALNAVAAAGVSGYAMLGFATGRFEEYPPRYDYDRIAAALLRAEPGERFGAAINNYLVKNLAFSKLRVDPENRMACYSLLGSRLPLEHVVGRKTWQRRSPLLHYRRPAPGVQWFVFRSRPEQEKTEAWLRKLGFASPLWAAGSRIRVQGKKPLLGAFRPVTILRLRPAAPGRAE